MFADASKNVWPDNPFLQRLLNICRNENSVRHEWPRVSLECLVQQNSWHIGNSGRAILWYEIGDGSTIWTCCLKLCGTGNILDGSNGNFDGFLTN